MNGNIRRLSYIENGKRYAVCTECRNKWNIAKGQIVLSSGYVCPNCDSTEGEESYTYQYIIRFTDGTHRIGLAPTMSYFTAELWEHEWEKRKIGVKVKSIDIWRKKRK